MNHRFSTALALLVDVVLAATVVLALSPAAARAATPAPPKPAAASGASSAASPVPRIAATRQAWHRLLRQLPKPAEGCYTATFPRVEWKAVPCGAPPDYPMLPSRGAASHFIVGGGVNDFAANPTGTISAVEGTFPSISSGLTESGPIANAGPAIANAYTFQINTNQFTSATACAGSPNPDCKGWEQFVYENNNVSHRVFIQYWLIRYNAPCPSAAWTQFSFTTSADIYCYQSTTTTSLTAGVPASSFGSLTFSAAVTATSDQVTISTATDAATRVGVNAVGVAAGWTDAEFNVFGDGGNSSGGGQAGFGANSTIVVKTTAHNGTRNAPGCVTESFTGETNNLTLVGTSSVSGLSAPAIEFTQSNVSGSAAGCATAGGTGDVHLTTFGGLLYDFQATGDFVLVEAPDFRVESRQVSGAPTWPNASVVQALGVQMGTTKVAFCTAPSRLVVDGEATEVADGTPRALPSGVEIVRHGDAYTVVGAHGDSVHATLHSTYFDVSVGLGRWPVPVRGVLANAGKRPNQIATRSGAVLTAPFAFADLYHRFADSWRVAPGDSLLSPCGERPSEAGIPKAPFYAKALAPEVFKRSREVCMEAGVRVPAWIEACTIDVAVIGESAAKAFVGKPAPKVAGRVVAVYGRGRAR